MKKLIVASLLLAIAYACDFLSKACLWLAVLMIEAGKKLKAM